MGACDAKNQPIRLVEVVSNSTAASIGDARRLLFEYGRFVLAQLGAAQFCMGTLENEAAGLPGSYLNRSGGCLVAYVGKSAAGFVAWRIVPTAVSPNTWEMKRLWVSPAARGLGLGRTLTLAVLDRARSARQSAVYLDTVPESMADAYRLYLELGFKPIAPYNDNTTDGVAHLSYDL